MSLFQKELEIAVKAVEKASILCSRVQQSLVTLEAISKKDRSPVTIADFGSQAIINLELAKGFSDDHIISEEESGILKENPEILGKITDLVQEQEKGLTGADVLNAIDYGKQSSTGSGRFWTIDPIDGTKGFLRGEQYAVALALIEDSKVVLGILGCPNFPSDGILPDGEKGGLLYGVKGQGSFFKSLKSGIVKKISADTITDPAKARFCESVEAAHASHDTHLEISNALGITAPPYRIDSQAKYAAVATGRASLYLRLPRSRTYREKIWDHGAGVAVIQEAGGKVTDFSGNELDFTCGHTLEKNMGILVSNGHIHKAALQAIAQAVGP